MVHLFLTEALAVDLLALCQRAGMVPVIRELHAELGPAARLLPCDDLPVLSVWYRGSAADYYHEDTADVMFQGMREARERLDQTRAERLPLLAEAD